MLPTRRERGPQVTVPHYPNGRGPMYNNSRLMKGRLWSTTRTPADGGAASDRLVEQSRGRILTTRVNEERWVEFQFNPPQLELQIQHQPTDNDASVVDLDPWQKHVSPGLATSKLELLFERSMEVYRGDEGYATLGVAKDILDVYSVINGDDEEPQPANISDFTNKLTDLVTNGSEMAQSATVAVQFSPNLVLFGIVMGWQFTFVKFNRELVPIMGKVFMNLTVMNANDRTSVRSISTRYGSTGPDGEDNGSDSDSGAPDGAEDGIGDDINNRGQD